MVVKTYPRCPHCDRAFQPGVHWLNANRCRLWYLMGFVEAQPGVTTADLANLSGMAYADVSKAMTKGRGLDIFSVEAEEREAGGIRYHHTARDGWRDIIGSDYLTL